MTAKCCCGNSAISPIGEPTTNAICHCNNCRARTGSAFGWSTYFVEAAIKSVSGPLNEYVIQGPNPQIRYFCAICGTTLFWKTETIQGKVGVAGGCFTDPVMTEPQESYADDFRSGWVKLPASCECHDLGG